MFRGAGSLVGPCNMLIVSLIHYVEAAWFSASAFYYHCLYSTAVISCLTTIFLINIVEFMISFIVSLL